MNIARKLAAVLIAGTMATTAAASVAGSAHAAPLKDVGPAATTQSVTAKGGSVQSLAGGYATMTIRSIGGGNYSVNVFGKAYLPSAVPTGYSIKLIGEDPWFDDTPVCDEWPLTTYSNGYFSHTFTCTGALLNEDLEGQDENYAKVTVFPAGQKSFTLRSNTVKGYY